MWLNVCSRLKPSMRFVRFAPFCPSGNIKGRLSIVQVMQCVYVMYVTVIDSTYRVES